ncbi:MAG TPA: hypothetical protein VFG76_06835 [Candidatus Polarisedimenticolia bacterium]|nr:hypothetical protein [Candidatus Polarisedimenticolia bacterium]
MLALSLCPAAIETSTVTGKVYTPDGQLVTAGSILATLSGPGSTNDTTSGATQRVAARASFSIDPNGSIVAMTLVPNDAISPSGTYYRVAFTVSSPIRASWEEMWVVASSPDPVEIGDVARINVAPGVTVPQYCISGACDTLISSPADGQVLTYETATSKWKNKAGGAGKPLEYFRANQAGTIKDRYYLAGITERISPSACSITPDMHFALPFISAKAQSVDAMQLKVEVGGGLARIRFCIYANKADGDPYPGALVHETGTVTVGTTGIKDFSISPAVALEAGALYWITTLNNDATGNLALTCSSTSDTTAIYGVTDVAFPPAASAQVADTYSDGCANPFPSGGSAYTGSVFLYGLRFSN